MRLAIELMTAFCGSPNVECDRIVRIERESGDYKVPLHEFTKHALLGDYAYYNALSSTVACNVFDVSENDPREHFLCSLIVGYLGSSSGIRDNDGFFPGPSILAEVSRLGFTEEQGRNAIKRLAQKRLIETPHGHYREVGVDDIALPEQYHFRATSIGLYHARFWVGSFAFLDATSIDTPVFDEEVRGLIFSKARSFDIADRYARTESFKNYLLNMWLAANFDVTYFDFPTLTTAQLPSFSAVSKVVNGQRQTPR